MKAYLSVPIIAKRSVGPAWLIAGAIRAAGHELVSPWVLADEASLLEGLAAKLR